MEFMDIDVFVDNCCLEEHRDMLRLWLTPGKSDYKVYLVNENDCSAEQLQTCFNEFCKHVRNAPAPRSSDFGRMIFGRIGDAPAVKFLNDEGPVEFLLGHAGPKLRCVECGSCENVSMMEGLEGDLPICKKCADQINF